eukprot:2544408-Ditylum_brightwellii.AAC.1
MEDDNNKRRRRSKRSSKKIDPWSVAIAASRANFLPDFRYSLTPMLDMFNHDSMATTRANVILASKNNDDDNNDQ